MGSDFERNFEEHLNYFWLYGVAGVIQQQSLLLQLAPWVSYDKYIVQHETQQNPLWVEGKRAAKVTNTQF